MHRIICLCLFSLNLYADTTSCPSEPNSLRNCIKTTCDASGYCSDLLYDQGTRQTQPFPASNDQEVTKQKIIAIDITNKRISLEDGSQWNISDASVSMVSQWKAGDLVQLNHSLGYGSTMQFNLINISRSNKTAVVTLFGDITSLRNPANFQRSGKSLNTTSYKICLSDGICWQYNPLYSPQPLSATSIVNLPILYAVNTGLDALTEPVQLVLLGTYPPTLIAVKLSQP
jgi:hypothetical protein